MVLKPEMFRSLCRARDLLGEVEEGLPVEEVARAVAISPFHFIRRFEAVFGVTPHQFRTRRRLDRAKQLLSAGGHSVTEVCMEVGFSSLGSFTELFKRRVGASPLAYRRRVWALGGTPAAALQILTPGCFTLMGRLPAAACSQFPRSLIRAPLPDSVFTNRTARCPMKIKLHSIMVEDQDKALKFYTDVLGFKKKHDIPVGEYKWLTVVSPEGPDDVELVLEPNNNPAAKAFQEAMFAQKIPLSAFEVERPRGGVRPPQGAGTWPSPRSRPAPGPSSSPSFPTPAAT